MTPAGDEPAGAVAGYGGRLRRGSRSCRPTTRSRSVVGGARRALPARRRARRGRRRLHRRHTRRDPGAGCPVTSRCHLLWHDVNQGMSEAYNLALTTLRARLRPRRARRRRPRVHRRRRRPARPRACSKSSRAQRSARASTRMLARRDLSVPRPIQEPRQLGDERLGELVGRQPPARRGVGVPDLPPRLARARARLLPGLQVHRDRRGRGRAVAASDTACATTSSCRCRSSVRAQVCATH